MKIVYFGTPQFSAMILENLIKSNHQVVAVCIKAEKPSGRNGKVLDCAVKQCASKYDVPVLQFEKLDDIAYEELNKFNADVFITMAYGVYIPKRFLNMTKHGVYNIHPSLLPKYRGSSPIQWAIMNGDAESGVTVLKSSEVMDAGDILIQKPFLINSHDSAGDTYLKIVPVCTQAILQALDLLEKGSVKLIAQKHEDATFTKLITKELGHINFTNSNVKINNLIRGLNPWPVAYFVLNGNCVKVYSAKALSDVNSYAHFEPGQIVCSNKNLIIKCAKGLLEIISLQVPGGKIMDAKSFLNGRKIEVGSVCE